MSDEKLSDDFWIGVFSPFLLILLVFAIIVFKAFVLTCLWEWYIRPMFHLPALQLPYAFGLSLLMTQLVPFTPARDKDRHLSLAIAQILNPVCALIMGWIGAWFL
jgi:hypothetical protein